MASRLEPARQSIFFAAVMAVRCRAARHERAEFPTPKCFASFAVRGGGGAGAGSGRVPEVSEVPHRVPGRFRSGCRKVAKQVSRGSGRFR